MQIFLYTIIFIMGCFFGSFCTLAVYRIPKKEDILIKHSYCPNCNHKLGFLDLFPLFSYILLRGKCRYCKTKIRPRYFIIELCSGIAFLLLTISLKVNIDNLNIISLLFNFIYVSILVIIAGIDKEKKSIDRNVLTTGFIIEIAYMIYECTLKNVDVYKYVIYSIALIILLVISAISLKVKMKERYFIQVLFLSLYMIIFSGAYIYILTVILTLISLAFHKLTIKKKEELPIGFFICVSNILTILITNFICNYLMWYKRGY